MRPVRGLSLELKLPLFITALIAVVVLALALLARREVRLLAEERTMARLLDVSEQFATASAATTQRRSAALARAARHPALLRAARERSPLAIAAAESVLAALPGDSTVLGNRLRDGRDSIVASSGDPDILDRLTPPPRSDSAWSVGPFVRAGDTVAFATSIPLREDGRIAGRVVQWRRVLLSAQGRETFRRFIGSDAEVYFGNGAGDLWIDMAGQIAAAPGDTAVDRVVRSRRGDVVSLSVIRPLAGTPWVMSIEIPESYVMAQPSAFLRRFAVVSVLLLLLGALLAVLLSQRMTRPLRELTAAADRLAEGDYSAPPPDDSGTDEIGRLARAFRIMSLRVQDTQRQLEADVAERQQEIRSTYEKLEAALESKEEGRDKG